MALITSPSLLKKFGGFVEGQYYFTNQWFFNALYAFSKAYGVSRSLSPFGINPGYAGYLPVGSGRF